LSVLSSLGYSAPVSQQNLEVVGRTFEAVGRRDWASVAAELDPDVEIEDRDIPDADEYRGRDGFFTWLEKVGVKLGVLADRGHRASCRGR
jgi:ketosteroid isomerase-like protein